MGITLLILAIKGHEARIFALTGAPGRWLGQLTGPSGRPGARGFGLGEGTERQARSARRLLIDLTPVYRSRDRRCLMLGELMSVLGTQLTTVVMPYQVLGIPTRCYLRSPRPCPAAWPASRARWFRGACRPASAASGCRPRTMGRHPHRASRLVEVAGIEPASFSTSPGLLRAQLAVLFSAPAITQASRRRAQPLSVVPPGPAAASGGGSS
jgi:hypothetical protein